MTHLLNFGGNPFNTPTGQKIEHATDVSLASENWALNMEICDLINETDEGPKDAIKAIRKRLHQNMGKNHTVVLHTLTVLETCVKNCGKRFQLLVCNKDFVSELFKLIGPKNDPPAAVQERVLGLIQSWADAFQGNPDLQGVCQIYQDLKQKGIEFPMTDLDAMAPIHTPQRTVPAPKQSAPVLPEHPPQANLQPVEPVMPARVSPNVEAAAIPSSAVSLNQEQLVKLRSELNVVEGNMKVFGEMLTELTPGNEHPQDLELLQELHRTCFSMQTRIVELIDKVGIEEVTSELLRINDELNNLFLRFERYEKKRTVTLALPKPVVAAKPVEDVSDKPLIDFGDSSESSEADIAAQLSDLNVSKSVEKVLEGSNSASAPSHSTSINAIADEFDVFAHSRNITSDSARTRGSSYADNLNIDQVDVGLASYAQNKGQLNAGSLEQVPPTSITSNDFEKFLAERAVTEEKPSTATPENQVTSHSVPPVAAAAAAVLPSQSVTSGMSNKRQIEKEDAENALFAL